MATSDYLKREEAAKKQLGAKGVSKRVKQLPTAARASLREMTGIDVSRRGVSIDPAGVALAAAGFIPLGKIASIASKASRAAKVIKKAPDEFVKPYQTRAQRKANPTYVKATSTTAKKQLGKYHSVDAAYERYLDSSVSGPKKTPKPKTAKPTLSEVFARQQAKRDANQWNDRFGRMSSAEEMRILQKASRGTPAGRGGIGGIRAGQRKAE